MADRYVQDNVEITLGADIIDCVTTCANQAHATINTVFQAAWALTLSRIVGSDDIVFGYVVSGRDPELPGVENMLGLFINTLPLRIRLNTDESFLSFVDRIRQYTVDADRHSSLSIGEISLETGQSVGVIDNAIVYENYPVIGGLDFSKKEQDYMGMRISDASYFEQSTLNLSVKVIPGKEYTLVFRYNREIHGEASIVEFAQSFQEILKNAAENPEGKIVVFLGRGQEKSLFGFNDILE
jgi:non-ribosomal peptide synthetase component F